VTVNLAVLGCGISTKVKCGENAGRKLSHDFTVLTWLSKQYSFQVTSIHSLLLSNRRVPKPVLFPFQPRSFLNKGMSTLGKGRKLPPRVRKGGESQWVLGTF